MKKILFSIAILGALAAATPATAQHARSADRMEYRSGPSSDRVRPEKRGSRHGHDHWRDGRGQGKHGKHFRGKGHGHCRKGAPGRGHRRG